MEIEKVILAELERITGNKNITGDMTLFDDLELSSLEVFELIGNIEGEIGKEIDEERLGEVVTVNDLITFVSGLID